MKIRITASGINAVVIAAVAASALGVTSPAWAEVSSPGLACVESNDATPNTTYIGSSAYNDGPSSETFLCPMTVIDMSTNTIVATASVRDYNTTASVACHLRTCSAGVTSCQTSATKLSGAAFTGPARLLNMAAAGFFGGHALLICSMPAPMGLGSSQINNYEWLMF
jgi:hypothetical protein